MARKAGEIGLGTRLGKPGKVARKAGEIGLGKWLGKLGR